jgi:hypothetical protein
MFLDSIFVVDADFPSLAPTVSKAVRIVESVYQSKDLNERPPTQKTVCGDLIDGTSPECKARHCREYRVVSRSHSRKKGAESRSCGRARGVDKCSNVV